MDDQAKRAVAEAYYRAIDEETFDDLYELVADDVEYITDHGTMYGADAMYRYYTEERTVTNTTHDVFRWVMDGPTLIAEGVVDGEYVDDGTFDGGYIGVFEFDENAEAISKLTVYTRSVF